MFYLLVSLFLYTAAVLLLSLGSKNLNSNLFIAIVNTVAAIIPVGLLAATYDKKIFDNAKFGILVSIAAGVVLALYTIFLGKSFAENKVGIVTPIIFGGTIFLSTILSSVLFKEKITFPEGVGLGFLGIGFLIIIYVKATATN